MTIKTSQPVYLIVADQTEEFESALHYAARAATANGARVAVLHVMPDQDFSHWGAVEEQMKQEQRREAEKFLTAIGEKISGLGGPAPVFHLESGKPEKVVLKVIKNNPDISKLILGGDTHGGNPGPLVTYFAGKGMAQLTVPMTVVPGHLEADTLEKLV